MNNKIVIVDDEMIIRLDLKSFLEKNGYNVVGQASDGFDAINVCKQQKPDAVLMDIKMPGLDGLSASKIILQENTCSCIILSTAYCDEQFIKMATSIGVMGYVLKPIDFKCLIPSLEVAIAKSKEIKNLKTEIKTQGKKLEERKQIEIAKGLLIENEKMTENAAYAYIRKLSMDKCIPMHRISELIITKYSQ